MGLKASKHASSETLSLEEVARRPKLSVGEVPSLNLVAHSTYATFAALVYKDPRAGLKCPEGWEVFVECTSLHLDREGYYAVAYINRAMKHCVIAQRGTSEVLALRAGIWVYFEEPTIQFYLAEQFSRQVALAISLMRDAEEWVVSYTGHSLGAVLAACRAVEEDTFAVTFESPGSLAFLKKAEKVRPDSIDTHLIAYLRPPNPINTLKPHCGYMVMLPAVHPNGTPVSARRDGSSATTGSATSLMILPPTDDSPPELAAHSPIMSELPPPRKEEGKESPVAGGSAPAASPPPTSAASPGAGGEGRAAAPAAPAQAPSRFSPSRFRMPSLRPQGYLRDYVLGSAGLGIPELQQYVTKVEPLIREMLERTQQLHSIHSILEHFLSHHGGAGSGESGGEMVVVRWPTHLMQFMEYYNTVRALEDPDNQFIHINAAYKSMMRRIFAVAPRPTDTIPLKYINTNSKRLVQLWWSWDATRRKALPLSLLEHKALNCIRVDGDCLRVSVLEPFQAKQFLSVLVARPKIAPILNRIWRNGDGNGNGDAAAALTSKL